MPKRTIAIVGLGAAARTIHLPAYRKIANLQVVGGCDPILEDNPSFPVYRDVRHLLDEIQPDLLAVVTPPSTHCGLVRLGLEQGCHVFCEKPFTPTLAEARDVIELARRCNRQVVVNNQYRFMNIHQAVRKRIGASDFGELLFVKIDQAIWGPGQTGWRGEGSRHTCLEFGTHVLDLCRFFFSDEPVSVRASMPTCGRADGADYLNLIELEFSGDRFAHITLDRLCRGPHRYLSLRLDGAQGCIESRLGGGVELRAGLRGGTRLPFVDVDASLGGRARLYHGYRYETIAKDPLNVFANATARLMQRFLKALDDGVAPPCNAADNYRTLALMEAAYLSQREKKAVPLARYDLELAAEPTPCAD